MRKSGDQDHLKSSTVIDTKFNLLVCLLAQTFFCTSLWANVLLPDKWVRQTIEDRKDENGEFKIKQKN